MSLPFATAILETLSLPVSPISASVSSSPKAVPYKQATKRKKSSEIWAHFLEDGKGGRNCKYCNRIYKSTTTTGNLRDHMLKDHPVEWTAQGPPKKVPTIPVVFQPTVPVLPKLQVDKINKLLIRSFVAASLPFKLAERPEFRGFCGALNPSYVPQSRRTVKRAVLKDYESSRLKLQLLKKVPGRVSVASDLWTSSAQKGYFAVKGHFID